MRFAATPENRTRPKIDRLCVFYSRIGIIYQSDYKSRKTSDFKPLKPYCLKCYDSRKPKTLINKSAINDTLINRSDALNALMNKSVINNSLIHRSASGWAASVRAACGLRGCRSALSASFCAVLRSAAKGKNGTFCAVSAWSVFLPVLPGFCSEIGDFLPLVAFPGFGVDENDLKRTSESLGDTLKLGFLPAVPAHSSVEVLPCASDCFGYLVHWHVLFSGQRTDLFRNSKLHFVSPPFGYDVDIITLQAEKSNRKKQVKYLI